MAIRKITQYFDDIDGTQLADDQVHTIRFGIDGKEYVIDLSDTNAAEFRELMALYVEAAQLTPKPRKPYKRRAHKTTI